MQSDSVLKRTVEDACSYNDVGATVKRHKASYNRKRIPKEKTYKKRERVFFVGCLLGVFLCERFFARAKKCGKICTSKKS